MWWPAQAYGQSAPTQTAVPPCAISDDPNYAYSPEKPVQVGGSPMFGAARQRRYLDSLRGPQGQPTQYKRVGSVPAPRGDVLLDRYEFSYDGVEKPLTLYLDWHHFTEVRAPRGLTCEQPFNLGLPPPDPRIAREHVDALAVSAGSDPNFKVDAIAAGEPPVARVFDHFRLLAAAARAAAAAGKPLDPARLAAPFNRPRMMVLAGSRTCDGRTIPVKSIALVDPRGVALPAQETQSEASAIAKLVPGVDAGGAAFAAAFSIERPPPASTVRIIYAEACGERAAVSSVPISWTPARPRGTPTPAMRPAGARTDVNWIAVQAVIDITGSFRSAVALGGPDDLAQAALTAVASWRGEPARLNDSPVVIPVVVQVAVESLKKD